MQELKAGRNEAGQRLDKLLAKYLPKAPKSFYYKMLRKKNITLNGRKAAGNEIMKEGDLIRLFLSEETIEKFSGHPEQIPGRLPDKWRPQVIFETRDALFLNKPAGLLSQKASPEDISAVDYLLDYLLSSGGLKPEELKSFRPGICNRLDRNTSGLLAAGKSLAGLQELNKMFHDRTMEKYYLALVAGEMRQGRRVRGWLVKDETGNQVRILDQAAEGTAMIDTAYEPLKAGRGCTLLKVELITGRSHQIRAHLAYLGHPIIGDTKYGREQINRSYREKYGLRFQLLHSWQMKLPELSGVLSELSGKCLEAPLPGYWKPVLDGAGIHFPPGME